MDRYIIFYNGTRRLKKAIEDGSILKNDKFEVIKPFNKSVTILKYEEFRFTKRNIIEDTEYAEECIVLTDNFFNDKISVYTRKTLERVNGKDILTSISHTDSELDYSSTPIYKIVVFEKGSNNVVDVGFYTKTKTKVSLENEIYAGVYKLCSKLLPAKFIKEILK